MESDECVDIKNVGGEAQHLAGSVLKDMDEACPIFASPNCVLDPEREFACTPMRFILTGGPSCTIDRTFRAAFQSAPKRIKMGSHRLAK